jgi:hypothetical protein
MEADISILRKTGHFYFALTLSDKESFKHMSAWERPAPVVSVARTHDLLGGGQRAPSSLPVLDRTDKRIRWSNSGFT